MTVSNIIRFAVAIIASWIVMWLGRNRLSESLTQGLAFWVMFLILPLTFSDKATDKKLSLVRHILAATVGAVIVLILNLLWGGWQGR
jgi:uncharacterized membrane protein YeaQ/YmgE (transglycosylase-associated protein family)